MKRIAVVTGANRGIGFEIARQLARQGLQVILTSRNREKGIEAVEKLARQGLPVEFLPLDVGDPQSIRKFSESVQKQFGRVDVLVNNAGIYPDENSPEAILDAFKTNALGSYLMSEALLPLMKKNRYGRIANVSSGMGQLSEMEGGSPAYRISKAALNAVTRILASEAESSGVKVNSMCPGWVRTDMGGSDADRSVEEGADTAVWLATLPDDGPNGGFFRDRRPIPW